MDGGAIISMASNQAATQPRKQTESPGWLAAAGGGWLEIDPRMAPWPPTPTWRALSEPCELGVSYFHRFLSAHNYPSLEFVGAACATIQFLVIPERAQYTVQYAHGPGGQEGALPVLDLV